MPKSFIIKLYSETQVSGRLGMSRGSSPRHAQAEGDQGFAVQFNAETPWHFAQLCYPWVTRVTIVRITPSG